MVMLFKTLGRVSMMPAIFQRMQHHTAPNGLHRVGTQGDMARASQKIALLSTGTAAGRFAGIPNIYIAWSNPNKRKYISGVNSRFR